jgi:hypothetical protein
MSPPPGRRLGGLLLASALLGSAAAPPTLGAQEFQVNQAVLDELADEAWRACEEVLQYEGFERVPVLLATAEELRPLLYEEFFQQLLAQLGDEVLAGDQSKALSDQISRSLMAKYSFHGKSILVSPNNMRFLSRIVAEPALLRRETLRAILVHECIHAIDDQIFQAGDILDTLDTAAPIQAFNAVLEGHAQYAARKVCEQRGWLESFDIFTRCIGKAPEVDDPAAQQILEAQAASWSLSYYDGERFIQSVVEESGSEDVEDTVAGIYAAPPEELQLIFEPSWYLHPEQRPELEYRFDFALEEFATTLKGWGGQVLQLAPPQVKAALALLPEAEIDRIVENMRHNRVAVLAPASGAEFQQVVVALYEYLGANEALFFVRAGDRLGTLREQQAGVEGEPSVPEAIRGSTWAGTWRRRVVPLEDGEIIIVTVLASQGPLALEVIYRGKDLDQSHAQELCEALFAAATSLDQEDS